MIVLSLGQEVTISVWFPLFSSTFGLIVFEIPVLSTFGSGILLSMPKYFTLQEANEALDTIRPLMDQIQDIRREILARRPDVWPVVERAAGNGGSQAASRLVEEFERLDALVRQIHGTGALFKDLNLGLLDFTALKEGREVYLCWKYGEGDIEFWHEIEAGYAGRQPISSF